MDESQKRNIQVVLHQYPMPIALAVSRFEINVLQQAGVNRSSV